MPRRKIFSDENQDHELSSAMLHDEDDLEIVGLNNV